MLPPEDQPEEQRPASELEDEPRHPFTYRAPAEVAEDDPLTSEEVADEARRNDAVLVGAAGLMAAVFACTTIADSRILVHVKTGLYQASHGFLPPGEDVFSATADGRPWVNLHWLFDLLTAGLHALGGFTALTLFQVAAAVGLIVLILASRRSGVSSWWAAAVAVLGAVAVTPHLEARPVIVTLLGLAGTLWLLTRYRRDLDDRAVWWLVPLFVLWANLDPRMFLGLAVLLLYGVGELLGAAFGRPGFEDSTRRGRYWIAVAASAVGTLMNPFFWRAPLGAVLLYAEVDPAYRQYFEEGTSWIALPHLSVFQYPPAALLDHVDLLAALLLAAVAGVTLLLNRKRTEFGHVALWLGFLAVGLLTGRELPAAAIVFAVLAIQNAEDWFRSSFRQTYGTERGELLFSRGGRALTVIAFAVLAGLWLTGKIVLTDDGRRPGFGLDDNLAAQIASLDEVMNPPLDEGIFNFHAAQGDQLIWLGLRPFIDQRLELYAASGSSDQEDLITLHDDVRHALKAATSDDLRSGRQNVWRLALDRFDIIQAMPRLTLPRPGYGIYFDLLRSSDWRLADLGAAGALFVRNDAVNEEIQTHLAEHGLDLSRDAFRQPVTVPTIEAAWPSARTWTDSFVRSDPPSNEIARALHYLQHLEQARMGGLPLVPEAAFAFAYLAIRDCYDALAEDPQNLVAYQCLGRVYELLFMLESEGSGVEMRRRLYQSLDAYGQALTISPNEPATHERLVALYLAFNKLDLALRARDTYEALTGQQAPAPLGLQDMSRWDAMWDDVRTQVEEVTEHAQQAIEEDQPRLDAALFAWQNGCTLLALEIVDEDPEFAAQNADVQRLRALLLLESARPQEAFEQLSQLETVAATQGLMGWREALALASLALPDFERAAELWRADATEAAESQLFSAMQTVPVVGPLNGPAIFPLWQTSQAGQAMMNVPQQVAQAEFNVALCELEAGQIEAAEETLTELLDQHPLTAFTPLARFYLQQIRGELVTVSLGDESTDRYEAVESRLNRSMVTLQLKQAGPVVAEKPNSSTEGTSNE